MRFTGGDNLTGFKKLVHDVFMKNELRNGEGAYELSYAKAGRSGYSFGPVQWDLLQNHEIKKNELFARDLFADILTNAKDSNGNGIIDTDARNNILNKVATTGFLTPNQRNLIKDALSSSYGVQKINEAYLTELDTAITKIDGVINKVSDPENKAFLQTDLGRLFLIDYNNQFNISPNRQMERFLQGELVALGENKVVWVQIKGKLGIEDLLNFYLNTKYGQDHPEDLIRRFSNILEQEGVNNIPITREDAKFLAEDLLDILGKKYLSCIYDKYNDNWGIRDLIYKALSMWYNGYPCFEAQNKYNQQFKLDGLEQSYTNSFTYWIPGTSPIIMDLDGDGVETASVNDGAYFDHDANGFAEKTGWASSDDGLLAWDRNGDGIINDGTELFNDPINYPQAANRFQVLAQLDDNLDGKIDGNDSIWSNLKIWQDYDGDGYSSPDELRSLSELGVASINTGYEESNFVDPQENEHRQVGNFTWADGTTGTATDVWFKTDKMYTIANEWLDVPEDISALPDLQGYGNVYDLHQAMVRDMSGTLKSLVESFITQTDPAQRGLIMDQILFKWTGSDGIDPGSRGENIDARKLAVLEDFFGEPFVGVDGPNPLISTAPLLKQSYQGLFEMFYAGLMAQTHLKDLYGMISYTWDEATQSLKGELGVGISALQNQLTSDPAGGKLMLGEFARTLRGFQAEGMVDYLGFRNTFVAQGEELAWVFDSGGKNLINGSVDNDNLLGTGSHDAIRGDNGNDILFGNVGNDVLYGQAGDDYLYAESGDDLLDGGSGNDWLSGDVGSDMYLFGRGYEQDTIYDYDTTAGNIDTLRFAQDITRSDVEIIRSWDNVVFKIKGTSDQIEVQNWLYGVSNQLEKVQFGDGAILTGREITDISLDSHGTSGNDFLYGSSIDDRFYGEDGNDTIFGGGGDDLLYGGLGNDTLYGDVYYGVNGNDVLDGGPGNDMLEGDTGADLYLFGRGYGQDTINDYDTSGSRDTLRFGSDVLASDVELTRSGDDMVFRIRGTSDQVTVQQWMAGPEYQVEGVEFGDGVVLTAQEVTDSTVDIYGTSGDDVLYGSLITDRLHGYGGDDTLYGNAGDDLLDGGPGNDYLQGDVGSDTYLFGRGSGQDTIWNYDESVGKIDAIRFSSDVLPSDVRVSRSGDNLVLSIDGTSDQLTVGYYFYNYSNSPYRLEQVRFSDGTVWDISTIKAKAIIGTERSDWLKGYEGDDVISGLGGDDTIYGDIGNDTLDGGAGSDYLFGEAGDDTLRGGEGNDWLIDGEGNNTLYGGSGYDYLQGGAGVDTLDGGPDDDYLYGDYGNDLYLFGRGSGQDTVYDYDPTSGNLDTLRFSSDVIPSDVILSKDGENLVMTL